MDRRGKHLLAVGGLAVGGYFLCRSARHTPRLSGFGMHGLGGAEEEWANAYSQALSLYEQLAEKIKPLPDRLRSGYESVLFTGAASILKSQLQPSYDLGMKGDYTPAKIMASAAMTNLQRISPLIAADAVDPSGAKAEATIKSRLTAIAQAQEANEADRKLAEQGAMAWVMTKGGEAIGKGAAGVVGGVSKGAWAFLGQLPWWVYALGVGTAGLYLFGPRLLASKTSGLVGLGPEPVKTNPRRRRWS